MVAPRQRMAMSVIVGPRLRPSLSSAVQRVAARRRASTGTATSQSDVADRLPSNLRVRNMLHSSSQLFSPGSALVSSTWLSRTESAAERLASAAQHLRPSLPLRIGIVGDTQCGTLGLLNVLLDDPMADFAAKDNIEGKRQSAVLLQDARNQAVVHGEPFQIQYGDQTPFEWLRAHNVELVEWLNPRCVASTISKMYECDRLLFVIDDVTLMAHQRFGADLRTGRVLKLLRYFAQKPGTSLLVNRSGPQLVDSVTLMSGLQAAISEAACAALARSGKGEASDGVVHASIDMARKANEALGQALAESGPTPLAAKSWDHFATLFADSGFAQVRSSIEEASALTRGKGSSVRASASAAGATQTATFVLRRALDQALFAMQLDLDHAQQARGAANVLRQDVEMERARLFSDIFDTSKATTSLSDRQQHASTAAAFHRRTGDRSASVKAASTDAWGAVERTFSARLPWWRVLWKVDDVRAETEAAIERGFAKDLEQRLRVQTGRLISVAERLQGRVRLHFAELDEMRTGKSKSSAMRQGASDGTEEEGWQAVRSSPFTSPLLLNELRKYPLDVIASRLQQDDILTQPIVRRREQFAVAGGPMDVLTRRAQRSTLTTLCVTATAGLACLTGGLAGSSLGASMPAPLQLLALQPSTAAGLFGLVVVSSMWVMQSRWTRAKRRFWRDWERIIDGLDDDLQRNLRSAFDHAVAAQSLVAADGLQRIATRSVRELEEAQERIDEILIQLRRDTDTTK